MRNQPKSTSTRCRCTGHDGEDGEDGTRKLSTPSPILPSCCQRTTISHADGYCTCTKSWTVNFSSFTIRVQGALGRMSILPLWIGRHDHDADCHHCCGRKAFPGFAPLRYVVHLRYLTLHVPYVSHIRGDTDLVSNLFPATEAVRHVCQVRYTRCGIACIYMDEQTCRRYEGPHNVYVFHYSALISTCNYLQS